MQEYEKKKDLLALLEEGPCYIEDSVDEDTLTQMDLKIKLNKMLPLSKNRLIGQSFDLVNDGRPQALTTFQERKELPSMTLKMPKA